MDLLSHLCSGTICLSYRLRSPVNTLYFLTPLSANYYLEAVHVLEGCTRLVGSGRLPTVISLRDLLAMTPNRLFALREYVQLPSKVPFCVCSPLIALSHTGRINRLSQAS